MSKLPESIRKELAALAKRPDELIDCSDLPELTSDFWQGAEVGKFYKPLKQQLTVRLDADVVGWLKGAGSGYQTRINTILRRAMLDNVSKSHG
jgi:uncharacterized protein (DUF4415 family)